MIFLFFIFVILLQHWWTSGRDEFLAFSWIFSILDGVERSFHQQGTVKKKVILCFSVMIQGNAHLPISCFWRGCRLVRMSTRCTYQCLLSHISFDIFYPGIILSHIIRIKNICCRVPCNAKKIVYSNSLVLSF